MTEVRDSGEIEVDLAIDANVLDGGDKLVTMRFDFKPASIRSDKPGALVAMGEQAQVTLHSAQDRGGTAKIDRSSTGTASSTINFQGAIKPARQTDAVLVVTVPPETEDLPPRATLSLVGTRVNGLRSENAGIVTLKSTTRNPCTSLVNK